MTDAVVVLDRSLHMPMRDLYYEARRCASVVASHISSKSSHRLCGIVGFAELASEISIDEMPGVDFAMTYGTNLMAAVALGQELLDHRPGRLITFSSFRPSAHTSESGEPFFSFPPSAITVEATIKQIHMAEDEGIVVDAFWLDEMSRPDHSRAVLAAIRDAGGEVIPIAEGACDASVSAYLQGQWS